MAPRSYASPRRALLFLIYHFEAFCPAGSLGDAVCFAEGKGRAPFVAHYVSRGGRMRGWAGVLSEFWAVLRRGDAASVMFTSLVSFCFTRLNMDARSVSSCASLMFDVVSSVQKMVRHGIWGGYSSKERDE